jgi:hypothetical protein
MLYYSVLKFTVRKGTQLCKQVIQTIITVNKCVKFQPIPFVAVKNLTKCEANAWVSIIACPGILRTV